METEASPGSGRVTRYIIHRLQPVVPRQGAVGDGRGVYDEVVRPAHPWRVRADARTHALRVRACLRTRVQRIRVHACTRG